MKRCYLRFILAWENVQTIDNDHNQLSQMHLKIFTLYYYLKRITWEYRLLMFTKVCLLFIRAKVIDLNSCKVNQSMGLYWNCKLQSYNSEIFTSHNQYYPILRRLWEFYACIWCIKWQINGPTDTCNRCWCYLRRPIICTRGGDILRGRSFSGNLMTFMQGYPRFEENQGKLRRYRLTGAVGFKPNTSHLLVFD